MAPDARQHGLHGRRVQVAGARDAAQRDVIHVAAGDLRDLRHAVVAAGRRQQEDQVHLLRAQLGRKAHAFLGRVVHHEHAVHAGRGRVVHEGAAGAARLVQLVIAFDRVRIAHQHDRRLVVGRAKCAHHGQHLAQPYAERQRLVAGLLDYGAVGGRVGERHAELDHVGAGLHHAVHQLRRDVGKREARRDVGNQRLAVLRLQRGKAGLNAAHAAPPFATNCTACSPPLTPCPVQLGRQSKSARLRLLAGRVSTVGRIVIEVSLRSRLQQGGLRILNIGSGLAIAGIGVWQLVQLR